MACLPKGEVSVLRNPIWTRDELIVTLDFYLTYAPAIPGKSSPELSALSTFLNDFQQKMGGIRPEKFRNNNGVYMKLMNLRRLDPNYEGKGLERGSKEDGVVWNIYSSRRHHLRQVANAIRSFVSSEVVIRFESEADHYEGEEGKLLARVHRYRERDTRLVRRKKEYALKQHGTIACEVCGFDFGAVYGDRGRGFIECHHKRPLSELSPQGEGTTTADLSLVCPNCHRMIHRSKPWLSIVELKQVVEQD